MRKARNLDSRIVYVGAKVWRYLVGKVTPKSETSSSPEEKLNILGKKQLMLETHH